MNTNSDPCGQLKCASWGVDCNINLPSSGVLEQTSLIIAFPAVFREDISLTCLKDFSEIFIKMLQVIFTEQALKTEALMVISSQEDMKLCKRFHDLTLTLGKYPRSFVAWRLRSRCLSSSIICLRSVSLSCSAALSLASSSLKIVIEMLLNNYLFSMVKLFKVDYFHYYIFVPKT